MTYSVVMVDRNGRASRIASGKGFFAAHKAAREASVYGKARVVSDAQWFAFRDGMVRSYA